MNQEFSSVLVADSASNTNTSGEFQVTETSQNVKLSGSASDMASAVSGPASAGLSKEASSKCNDCGNDNHKGACWTKCSDCGVCHDPRLNKWAMCQKCKKHHPEKITCPPPGVHMCGECGVVEHRTRDCPVLAKAESDRKDAIIEKKRAVQMALAQQSAASAEAVRAKAAAMLQKQEEYAKHQAAMADLHAKTAATRKDAAADFKAAKDTRDKANAAYIAATGKCVKCGGFCGQDKGKCEKLKEKRVAALKEKYGAKSTGSATSVEDNNDI